MGNTFSAKDYQQQVANFSGEFLTHSDSGTLKNFILQSEDFYNVTTTCMLEDFRKIKVEKQDNFVYLMSYVRRDKFNLSLDNTSHA
jgi:hypothetical protein